MRALRIPILVAVAGGIFLLVVASQLPSAHPAEEPAPKARALPRKRDAAKAPDPKPVHRVTHAEETPEANEQTAPKKLVGLDARTSGSARAKRHPLMLRLRYALALTEEQKKRFEEAFRERDEAVRKLQEGILEKGIFIKSEYVGEMDRLKALSYEKMGRSLDAAQHRRFLEIIAEGHLGDSILFKMPPDIEIRE